MLILNYKLKGDINMNCNICNKEFESFKELTKHLIKEHNFSTDELYKYFNFSAETKEATCPICGSPFKLSLKQARKFRNKEKASIGCCKKCSLELRSLLVESPFAKKEVREKAKQTIIERYGTEYATQNADVIKKTKQTNLKKYGVDNPHKSKEIREKTKQTNLKKYGVEHSAQAKEVQEKMKKTMLERYGVEHPAQAKEFMNKMKKTMMERYGVENASQSPEIKEKKKQTFLERYGVESVSQIPEFKEENHKKMKQTNLKRYGVEYPSQSIEIRNRMKKTNLERYGYEYTVETPEFQEKAKQTNLEKYGVDNVFKSEEFREKAQQTNLKKYGVKHASQSPEILERIKEANLERYGVEYFCQHERCSEANGHRISKLNKELHELLKENNIENELEFIIENYGYDLKASSTLVEIDPYYTHNVTKGAYFGGKQKKPIPVNYHIDKTNFAKSHGYSCLHIFDWDDWNKIVYLLKPKEKIQARKCTVKEIKNKKEAHEFLGKYHLQGSTKGFEYGYGLYYNDELIEVMTFGKPRYNKNYEYELLRLCSDPRYTVVGGASKLLKYFEKEVKPKSIISYCDLSKFNGEVYEKLGFRLKEQTAPAKHWYNPKTKRHITDNLLRQRGYDQLHDTNFGKGTSNEELMLEHGYVEIYDCGQLVFVKGDKNY